MVGESKILTVSYGTFSCTLEGFEDPFSTMKAIAEYFRDLAADDRFFGAEPPQPDADMLHKIAEQTIQSRVNAEFAENSVILRQDHSDAPPQTFDPSTAEEQDVETSPVAQAVAAAAPVAASAAFGAGDTIAEKLQRIRAVVARENGMSADQNAFFSEDQHADAYVGSDTSGFGPDFEPEDDGINDDQPAAKVEEQLETVSEDAIEEEYEAEAPSIEEHSEAEAVSPTEDEPHAEPAVETLEPVAADEGTSDEAVENTSLAEDSFEAEGNAEATSDTDAASEQPAEFQEELVAEAEAEAEAEEVVAFQDETAAGEAELGEEDAPKPRNRIVVQKISREEVEAAQPEVLAQAADPEPSDSPDLSEEAEADLLKELASAEADIDAAGNAHEELDEGEATDTKVDPEHDAEPTKAGQFETDEAEEPTDQATEVVAKTDEDAENLAIANLMAEDAAAEEAAEGSEIREPARQGHGRAALLVEDEDAALNRLMDATSSRMNDDNEGAVRRASIAHLKAAVAATKADESIAKAAADEDAREMDQYRDDLARVVRPVPARSSTDGQQTPRPSPLVLVSEQRIEGPEGDPNAHAAADIQPRRISTGNLALDQQYDSEREQPAPDEPTTEPFAEFVKRMKARELPEILEAAAAHFTVVEGQKEFTRPMLMRKIASVEALSTASREEGLRCFGALLRENKIEKSGAGQFSLSPDSRFLFEA